jgi:hypothetical protein
MPKRPQWIAASTPTSAVVIMSVQDFIRTVAPPPDWLQNAWAGARRLGVDALASADIEVEIAVHRHGKKVVARDAR